MSKTIDLDQNKKNQNEPLAGIGEETEGGAKSGNIWIFGLVALVVVALVAYTVFSGDKNGDGSPGALTGEESQETPGGADAQLEPGFFKRMQNWHASKRKSLEDSLVDKCGMSQKYAERTVTGVEVVLSLATVLGGVKLFKVWKHHKLVNQANKAIEKANELKTTEGVTEEAIGIANDLVEVATKARDDYSTKIFNMEAIRRVLAGSNQG